MYQFLSKEWIEALAEELKNDANYQKKAKGFDSLFQFVVEPCPDKGITETRSCGLLVPQATETWVGLRENADYTMTAPYDVFHKIAKGKLGTVLAITTKKAKVEGNFPKMLRYTAGTNKMVEILKRVPTSFEGDFD